MRRFLPILILTGLLFGQGWTQHSGVERNDIFQEYNEQPHEIDPTVFNNSNFRHLNTIRNQRDDLLLLMYIEQEGDGTEWVNAEQKTYTYDANNNQTSQLQQDWDGTQWVNDWQATYTYDANNNRTGYIRQQWNNTEWVNWYQYTYTYDANNNMTGYIRQQWNNTEWVNNYQYTYTYDANNNRTGYIQQQWNNTEWLNLYQYTYTYDANNNQTSYLSQSWDGTQWVIDAQTTYTYDANNNQTSWVIQSWDGTQWVNYWQYTFTYDANNNQTSHLYQNWDGTQWVNDWQRTYTYDANNNQTSYLWQDWDGTQWVNNWQNTYTYDANNNQTSQLQQDWDGTQWVNWYQYTFTYDGNNNCTISLRQTWDGAEWTNQNLGTSTWGNLVPVISIIPDQEMVEDQTLVLILTAQSPFSGDTFVFFAASDTSAVGVDVTVDTLHIVPAYNWTGMALITVIVDAENGFDTTGFTLTVNAVNDAPEPFSVIYPTMFDSVSTDSTADSLIFFTWNPSIDVDSDVTYRLFIELEFFANLYTDEYNNIADSTYGVESTRLDDLLSALNLDDSELYWFVDATDGEYTVRSDTNTFYLTRQYLNMGNEMLVPNQFILHQNYPNPFNPVTTLRYDLPENGHVNITIYDMLGRQVKTLINQTQDAGYRSVIWDATNDYGKPVSAGIYLYQIQAGDYMQTKKMVLLK